MGVTSNQCSVSLRGLGGKQDFTDSNEGGRVWSYSTTGQDGPLGAKEVVRGSPEPVKGNDPA